MYSLVNSNTTSGHKIQVCGDPDMAKAVSLLGHLWLQAAETYDLASLYLEERHLLLSGGECRHGGLGAGLLSISI